MPSDRDSSNRASSDPLDRGEGSALATSPETVGTEKAPNTGVKQRNVSQTLSGAAGAVFGSRTGRGTAAHPFIVRYGVLLAMVATFAMFSILSPNAFFTVLTMKGILRDCVPLLVMALGVTAVLVMNNYDLSVGGLTSLCATVVIMLLSTQYAGLNYFLAIALTLLVGAGLGCVNGSFIAYVGLPSFILTIAMGTVYTGAGLQLTNSNSVYSGIAPGYVRIASGTTLGFSNQVFIGLAILVICHVFLRHSEPGRYMYAIGGNTEAARLSGVPVRRLTTIGFAIAGIGAAITGILLTSEGGAVNPETGTGLLLPAYAAAFLGSSMFRVGVFTPIGTALGALFLQIIGTGLTILNLSGPLVEMIQGGILAAAVLVSRLSRKSRTA